MHHFRKTRKKYSNLNRQDVKLRVECSLCNAVAAGKRIAENDTMVIVENRVAYDLFEFRRTTGEHYLILPKRHVESLRDFTDQEKIDLTNLAGEYEAEGFNVYARGVGNISRSQAHQHTHLIRLLNKNPKLHVYVAKPYFVAHID